MRYELRCPACRHSVVCTPEEMLTRLQAVGKLKRIKTPDPEVLRELFRHAAETQFACGECGRIGLSAAPATDEFDDWGPSVACESCGQPVPAERIELFPGAKLCAKCQHTADTTGGPADVEYCPRCGSIMKLQRTRSGITRYQLVCPACS